MNAGTTHSLAGLTKASSYLVLPAEIWRWRLALLFRPAALIGLHFVSFIVSIATARAVRSERLLISAALDSVGAALVRSLD